MKFIGMGVMAALLLASPALAQERSAGQTYDAQVNWTVLSGKLDALNNQNKTLAASLVTLAGQMTNLTATVNALSSKIVTIESRLAAIDTKLAAIGNCGAQQKLWNGSACVDAGSTTQAGTVGRTGNVYDRNPSAVHVTFPKAFSSVPKVTVGLSGFTKGTAGSASCNAPFSVILSDPTNVTKTGFDVVLTVTGSTSGGNHGDNCGAYGLTNTIIWVATN